MMSMKFSLLLKTLMVLTGDDIDVFDTFIDMLDDLDDVQNIYHNAE